MALDAEARNVAPRLSVGGFWVMWAVVVAAGLVLLVRAPLQLRWEGWTDLGPAFLAVTALLVIGELRPVFTAGAQDANGVTISTTFAFALLIHWGLDVALVTQALATFIADRAAGKAFWRTGYNIAQFTLSWGAAWLVFLVFARQPSPDHPLPLVTHDLPVVLLAAVVYFVVNDLLVTGLLSLRDGTTLRSEVMADLGYQVFTTGALLALSPIVVLVLERGPAMVPLLIPPLVAVYATASVSVEKERQSLHDSLTGLPNRKLLLQKAREAVQESTRTNEPLALFLLDLDRFKEVNDTLGHQVGDALLQLVGQRLAATLRPGDTVARLGGDEFAVLLPVVNDVSVAHEVAERIRRALAEPFRHDGMTFELEASLGIALHPEHAHDFETLMQRADVAMYLAKESGTSIELYSPEKDRHTARRLGLLAELRRGLDVGEIELHYQPKADLATGAVVGVEALARWIHPDRGVVGPDEFIPLAEQSGLMRALTHFVVDEALAQAGRWRRLGLEVPVAINVSARDLYDVEFAEYLRRRLDHHELDAGLVQLEITESVLMSDPGRAAATLRGLSALGVGVSLDDFGTGYSSLVHLKRLPVTEIKIDRSFVSRMDDNEDDAAIVRSIVELAGALSLRVVAEGVETQESWDRLAGLGCDVAQGWFLSKALPAREATAWLQDFGGATPESGARLEQNRVAAAL